MGFVKLPSNRNTLEASFDLDPLRLERINRSANSGWLQNQSKLGRELLEKFPPLRQVWNVRSASISSLKWFIAGNDKQKNSFVRETLLSLESSRETMDFNKLLCHFQDYNLYGYSVAEIDWSAGGGSILGIKGHRPETVNFDIEEDALYLEQENGNQIYAESPRFICVDPSINPHRSGLVRPLSLLYVQYRHILMQYMRGVEKYGVPMPVVEVDDIMFEDSDERAKLETALANWTYDGYAIVPKDVVKFTFPTAAAAFSADPFRSFMDAIEKQVARLVLGQDSTTISEGSNRSTAAVHDGIRRDLLFSDARTIENVINEQIVKPLIKFNFGDSSDIPKFKFDMKTADEVDQVANIAAKLSGAGYEIDPKQLSGMLGVPVVRKEATKEQF